MKKNYFYALLGAIALTGAVGFSSCSSTEDTADVNPNYNPETDEVTVDLALNIGQGQHGTTRMSAANTQADMSQDGVTFRGIDYAFVAANILKNSSNALDDGKYVFASRTLDKVYNMGNLIASGSLNPNLTTESTTQSKSRRVVELALPSMTNNIMFWGRALTSGKTANQIGAVDWTVDQNLANMEATLKRRIPEDPTGGTPLAHGQTAFAQYQGVIAGVLNKIVNFKYDYSNIDYNGTKYNGTLYWSDYVVYTQETGESSKTLKRNPNSPVIPANPLCPLGEIMADSYVLLNTIYNDEMRAGSGSMVAQMLYDLLALLGSVKDATPTSAEEAVTKVFATQLYNSITPIIGVSTAKWTTTVADIKTFSGVAAASCDLVTEDINLFPSNFDVPDGAAILMCTIADADPGAPEESAQHIKITYSYKQNLPTYAMSGAPGGTFDIFNYRYPAELCYFGNSPVRVNDAAKEVKDYPDGTTNWLNNDSWSGWNNNSHVLSSTRSVAMRDNINYGSALLKVTVKYNTDELKDNNKAIQLARKGATEDDMTISTDGQQPFVLTGVLVGGVEPTVGWNYIAKAAAPEFKSFIYDKDVNSGNGYNIPANDNGATTPNYTLVWDNWNPASKGSKQNVVYIALEFENKSGKEFWGMNNMIHKNSKFYITGKLDPDEGRSITDRSEGVLWPGQTETVGGETKSVDNYALPPFYTAADQAENAAHLEGTTIKERRVFIQDYVTEANFVFGVNSLKSALVAVPDLRSSQISLGLSVDLKWNDGLKFEDIILGQ